MRTISRTSHSQFNSFDWCPRQWSLRYLDKAKVPPTFNLQFGIAIHDGIEQFVISYYIDGKSYDVALSNAISQFEFKFLLDSDMMDTVWPGRGRKMLKNVADLIIKKVDSIIQTESFYRKPLMDGVSFVGKVDCIAKTMDGITTIIDWKTANKNYTRKRVEKDNQLTYYRWLVGNHPLVFVVMNKETCEARWHMTTRTDEQVEKTLSIARRTHQEMEERKIFRGVYNNKCGYCEFNGNYCGGNTGDF